MNEQIAAALATTMGHFNRALEATPNAINGVAAYLQFLAIIDLIVAYAVMIVFIGVAIAAGRGAFGRYDDNPTPPEDLKSEDKDKRSDAHWEYKKDVEKAAESNKFVRTFCGFACALCIFIALLFGMPAFTPTTWASAVSKEMALSKLVVDAINKRTASNRN